MVLCTVRQMVLSHWQATGALEEEPQQTTTSSCSSRPPRRDDLVGVGRPLAPSTGSFRVPRNTCPHPMQEMVARGGRTFWWTCKACGSRWERINEERISEEEPAVAAEELEYSAASSRRARTPLTPARWPATRGPPCPACGAVMVHRRNRTHDGSFWGCSTFPQCRATRPGTHDPEMFHVGTSSELGEDLFPDNMSTGSGSRISGR